MKIQRHHWLRLWQLFKSVGAALLGVQSERNRQRDFSQSNIWPFLFLGIGAGLLLVIILLTIALSVSH